MKKFIFFAAVAALTLGACTKSELTNGGTSQTISFGTYVGSSPLSKATTGDITTNLLKSSQDGFGVYCYSTADAYEAGTSKPNFMLKQQVTYNTGKDAWVYTPVKYWPNNGEKLTFRAYAPYSDGTQNGISELPGEADGNTTLKYTLNADAPVDLLYAGTDGLTNLTKPAVDGTVSFTFKHALSKISFKHQAIVDNGADFAAGTTIVLKDVKVDGAALSEDGTFDFATGEWTPGTAKAVTLINKADLDANVTKTATDLGQSFLAIPGTSQALNVTVTYDVVTADSHYTSGNVTITNTITNNVTANLVAGKHYVFNLQIGVTSVKVGVVTVSSWEDVTTGTGVDLPKNSSNN